MRRSAATAGGTRSKSGWPGAAQVNEVTSRAGVRKGPGGGFRNEERVAIFGVQFAHSLATALVAASVMLLVGSVLVRAAVRAAWSRSADSGRRGGRVVVVLAPALADACEWVSPVRPSAGVAAVAPTRAPPVVIGAAGRRPFLDAPGDRFRLAV